MRRVINATFVMALAALMLVSTVGAQTYVIQTPQGEMKKAEDMINIAKKAGARVGLLIEITMANETAMNAIENASLTEAFNGNVLLCGQGVELLNNSINSFNSGDYSGALTYALQAMEAFRDAFRGINNILCQAGIAKGELLQAQGLLVAANCALKRIESINKSLSVLQEKISAAQQSLNESKELLEEIPQLLKQGNVSDAAHYLAEANRLMNMALNSLRLKAKENMARRMERFMERFTERFRELHGKLKAKGINVTDFITNENMTDFLEDLRQLKEEIKLIGPEGLKGLMGRLISLQKRLEAFGRKVTIAVEPKQEEGVPALEVNVIKGERSRNVVLEIEVKNAGNATLQFPNTAYGITIEKSEDGSWKLAYTPISAQTIVELKPGKSKSVTIMLKQPQPGEYRVHVHGWCKLSGEPVEATADFSLP